jgi:RNA polymerase sigma-70 factor (ECF subfamily)
MDVEALFRAYAPFVASFLSRLGVPQADVDDRVQEVFLVAHRKGGYVPGAGQPRTWLAAIALRVASTGRRSQRRRREDAASGGGLLDATPARSGDPGDALETQRALERVQRALDSLDDDHRAAFVLYELEGESCEAIAESFGVPVGTVYSRLHNARKRFSQSYEALGHEPRALRARLAGGT